MQTLMTHFYVIAQNGEEKGWIQILIYIVIAAFWIIGGILKKVRDNKVTFEQDSEHSREEPPVRKAGKKQPHITPLSIEPAKAQPSKQTFAVEIPTIKTDLSAELHGKLKLKAKPIEKIDITKDISAGLEEEIPQKIELNLEDTDQLKKAIIYTEILGKPVSLRD